MATPAQATTFGTAVRRVVVTPTFAAGLGVVIAAGMAYPMTKTVISYGGTPPAGESPCVAKGCVNGTPDGSGSLATASPGTRLAPPSSAATRPDPTTSAPGAGGAVAAGPPPVMQYQTLRQWQSGFIGQITITDSSGSAPADWQLRIDYEWARIIGVWGGRWSPQGDHGVLVTPDGDGGSPGGGSHVQVVVVVSGQPGPPSGCVFNGQACQSSQSGGGPASGDWQPDGGHQHGGDHFGR